MFINTKNQGFLVMLDLFRYELSIYMKSIGCNSISGFIS